MSIKLLLFFVGWQFYGSLNDLRHLCLKEFVLEGSASLPSLSKQKRNPVQMYVCVEIVFTQFKQLQITLLFVSVKRNNIYWRSALERIKVVQNGRMNGWDWMNKYLYIFNLEWKIYFWFGFQSCINIIIIIDGGANDRIQSLDGAVGCRLSSLTLELFLRPHWCRRSKTEYCSITVVVKARWGFCSYKKKTAFISFRSFFF